MSHELYMQRCLQLAELGKASVAPNPMVGAVIVYSDTIIGEGYHTAYGQPHAEVEAIRQVKDETLLPLSTLYVNLEPCSHFGKTPPCADLILEKKIPRVVIACLDPNPLVSGKGVERLQQAGVEVRFDVLHKEARFLNRRFFTFQEKKRPYIILKWAESREGFMAPEQARQQWLSGTEAKTLTHQWRSEESAILIGRGTWQADNPSLTTRLIEGKNPTRVLIAKEVEQTDSSNIFSPEAPVLVFNAAKMGKQGHVEFIKIDFGSNVITQIAKGLFERQLNSLIVEGGAHTLQSFIDASMWDEARVFSTGTSLEKGKAVQLKNYSTGTSIQAGNDTLTTYYHT